MIMEFEYFEISGAEGIIKKMDEKHIVEVSQIHSEALSGDLLPSLGNDFLRILYKGLLENNQNFSLVYLIENKVIGFVLGSKNTNKLFKEVIKRTPMNTVTETVRAFILGR